MKTVVVLMSTYNGERFLREQIDSVLAQENVDIQLIVRDDGSCDSTLSILMEYAEKYSNIIILPEKNCGAEMSFHNLCEYAKNNTSADYYAFCDQDDVWDSNKLKVAIDSLEQFQQSTPNLYFSNLKMVDENLSFIRDFYAPGEVFVNRNKTLVQIFTYGCTCVFNRKALTDYCVIKSNQTYHDNWIFVVCSYLGNVVYDPIGYIQYRQHNNNLSGHRYTGLSLLFNRIIRIFKGNLGHHYEIMAHQLLLYKERLLSEDLKLIKKVATYRNDFNARLYLLFSSTYSTGHFMKDLCIKFRILINKL